LTVLVTCYCSLVYAAIGRFLSFAWTRQTTTGHSGLDTCTLLSRRVVLYLQPTFEPITDANAVAARKQDASYSPSARAEHKPDCSEVVKDGIKIAVLYVVTSSSSVHTYRGFMTHVIHSPQITFIQRNMSIHTALDL